MQRTDGLNIQVACFFEQSLNLHTVFPDNAEIIAACFTCPVLLCIKSTEFAESIGREKNLVTGVISDNDFRPVYHGSCHKG